jgi:hypothetical protein
MRKAGEISSWNPAKFVGMIIDRSVKPPQRYFLFASRVISGPEPFLGAHVLFDVDQRPALPGKLRIALRVEVLDCAL